MARDKVTRRDLLRGVVREPAPQGHSGPIVKPGETLPDLISWLDPEMRPTPHRGSNEAAFALLRPPGAVAEPDFLESCSRCGDCASACPHDAIRAASAQLRGSEGTPIIDPLLSPCLMCEDFPCISACETGALRSEAPAALGAARVQPIDCLNRLSASCSVCVERCPVPGAIAFVGDVPEVNERMCTGCGVCQYVCPAPHNAILMLPNTDRPTARGLELADPSDPSIELPDLHEAMLDEDGLRSLFRDLDSVTRIERVRCKVARDAHATKGEVSASEALALLLSGAVRGVQVWYRYDEQRWCDTILRTPQGHRVVRVASPEAPSSLA
jgi:MauM/NapG family ferredoxin protein